MQSPYHYHLSTGNPPSGSLIPSPFPPQFPHQTAGVSSPSPLLEVGKSGSSRTIIMSINAKHLHFLHLPLGEGLGVRENPTMALNGFTEIQFQIRRKPIAS